MTLVLHDWFGVGNTKVEQSGLMTDHIALLRDSWRGSFRDLLKKVAVDGAMLVFLDGRLNAAWSPNENFARELMELYALGPNRGAYTEADVREAARALTGWRTYWDPGIGYHDVYYDGNRFDRRVKTLFADTHWQKSGVLNLNDVIDAVVDHPLHPSFVALKLWSYFVPNAPAGETLDALSALYRKSGERLEPLIRAILQHPDFYDGPSMAKSPAVHTAGLMRCRGQGLTTSYWITRMRQEGQFLGDPPSVAGWNDDAWINSGTFRARWQAAVEVLRPDAMTPTTWSGAVEDPGAAVQSALAHWDWPVVSDALLQALYRVANTPRDGREYPTVASYAASRWNVLRQMIVVSPDYQVC